MVEISTKPNQSAEISATVKDRVLQLAGMQGYRLEDFFEKIGASYANFKGKSKKSALGSDVLAEISSIIPDANIEWLITGKGQPLKSDTSEVETKPKGSNNRLVKAPVGRLPKRRDTSRLIDFYDVDFAAGEVEFFDDINAGKPVYSMDIPEFYGCTAFRTYSNSMERLILSGDILFGTKLEDWRDGLEYGQIYGVVSTDRRKFLKYIRKCDGKEDTHFLLKSENTKEYDDFTFQKDRIKSVWLIHGWLKKRTS